MEISEAHARELERQRVRKAELEEACTTALSGVNSIVFEAGCGHGHWLTSYAEANPSRICVGIDLISWRIRKACEKRDKRDLTNLHFFKAELSEFLEMLPTAIRFDKTVLLFPDPWPKARHHRRRMVQPHLLDALAKRSPLNSTFHFRTDDRPYYDWTLEHLEAHLKWEIEPDADWPHEMETYFQSLMEQYYSVTARRLPDR